LLTFTKQQQLEIQSGTGIMVPQSSTKNTIIRYIMQGRHGMVL
jgi:hypothetical protein